MREKVVYNFQGWSWWPSPPREQPGWLCSQVLLAFWQSRSNIEKVEFLLCNFSFLGGEGVISPQKCPLTKSYGNPIEPVFNGPQWSKWWIGYIQLSFSCKDAPTPFWLSIRPVWANLPHPTFFKSTWNNTFATCPSFFSLGRNLRFKRGAVFAVQWYEDQFYFTSPPTAV